MKKIFCNSKNLIFLILVLISTELGSEKIQIESLSIKDQDWNILYIYSEGYISSSQENEIFRKNLDTDPSYRPTAIFLHKPYRSEIETNRKITRTYGSRDYLFSEEVEEDDVSVYPEFLRIHCRIPTNIEFRLEKEGKLEGTYQSRNLKEIECEKNWITRTWKGNGLYFLIHRYYYRIPDVTNIKNIPEVLIYIGTILCISFIALGILFFFIKFLMSRVKYDLNVKLIAIIGSLFCGFFLMFLAGMFSSSSVPQPHGIKYYCMMLFLISGIYTILCFLPFWGLVNYFLLGDESFPLWLILVGFFLAPLVIFAAGGARGGSGSTSSTRDSGGKSGGSSSSVVGGGGTFGGGGASGQW